MADASAIARLVEAIGYPAEVPPGATSFSLTVDGQEMTAVAADGRLRLERVLRRPDGAPADLAALAGYAAGRILKEEATLAWDPEREAPILWQEVPDGAPHATLRRFFEVFATSCDWWQARLGEAQVAERIPEMMIMP